MDSKILCTFVPKNIDVEDVVKNIWVQNTVLFGKIFALHLEDQPELALTYNVEVKDIETVPTNTILVHRRKQTNTLYTINALNVLVKSLNRGRLDRNFMIDWNEYRNTIILTKGSDLRKVRTKLYKIYSSNS